MRAVRATMARLCAFMMSLLSPVRPKEKGMSGMHCDRPPPAALPLMFMVGPPEGWRMAPVAFLPRRPRPWRSPMVEVLLPSPSGVGVMAVTSMYLPSGRSPSRSSTGSKSTLP